MKEVLFELAIKGKRVKIYRDGSKIVIETDDTNGIIDSIKDRLRKFLLSQLTSNPIIKIEKKDEKK